MDLLHAHKEDEHKYAKHQHLTPAQHHCELDELLCEQQPDVNCEHPFHISTPKHKCVSCTYHFAKHYITTSALTLTLPISSSLPTNVPVSENIRKALIRISNKGPPSALTLA